MSRITIPLTCTGILKICISFQPLTTDGPLKSHTPLPDVHEKGIKGIIYRWLNMYVITINHTVCNFFLFLMDSTLSRIYLFFRSLQIEKGWGKKKIRDWCNKLHHREPSEKLGHKAHSTLHNVGDWYKAHLRMSDTDGSIASENTE